MNSLIKSTLAFGLLAAAGSASAQAIIDNGTIQLGVDQLGQLNIGGYASAGGTSVVGLRDLRTGFESTAPGCLCEGWGIADVTNGYSGFANNSSGTGGLTFVSFNTSGTGANANSSAQSARTVSTTGNLKITHNFGLSASNDLYRVVVTIENTGTTNSGLLRYRRTMDWDVEPTPFNEYSTIQGAGGNVIANNNGFCSSDPLAFCGSLGASGNFIDFGPTDHGANFDINLPFLAAGASRSFSIFYGASLTEAGASAALTSVGANVYSWGQNADDQNGGNGSTFIFGFRGISGDAVPEPQSWVMLIAGFGMVGAAMRRRKVVMA